MQDHKFTVINNNPMQQYRKEALKQINIIQERNHVEIHKHEYNTPLPSCNSKAARIKCTHQNNKQLGECI
jgi:hypothetical protein